MAFKCAGSIAFRKATRAESPMLLKPLLAIEIDMPDELTAAIRDEIHAHRGPIAQLRGSSCSAPGNGEIAWPPEKIRRRLQSPIPPQPA
jgi:hypothetical protein